MSSLAPVTPVVPDPWRLADPVPVMSPALAILPAQVDRNVAAVITALDDHPGRWRPHVKTTKSRWVARRLLERGVHRAKCATPAELEMLCAAGFDDILVAVPATGAVADRVASVAARCPGARVAAVVDDPAHLAAWRDSPVELFVDIDVGMRRTGIPVDEHARVRDLAERIAAERLPLAGLHVYDGHLGELDFSAAERQVARDVDALARLLAGLEPAHPIRELVLGGTPSFLSLHDRLAAGALGARDVTLGAGTVVFGDLTSVAQVGRRLELRPAVAVLSRVVSHPASGLVTCDAGLKAVTVDSGVPNCVVAGHPGLVAERASEEHLVLAADGDHLPAIGDVLSLVPRHVCTTVGNFDTALLIEDGAVVGTEAVSARGRGAPLTDAALSLLGA